MFAPYFANLSSKMNYFCWFCRKSPAEMPQYLSPLDIFSKKLTSNCSSTFNDEVPGEKVHLMSKVLAPQQFCQKAARIGAKTALFWFFSWATATIEMTCTFSSRN